MNRDEAEAKFDRERPEDELDRWFEKVGARPTAAITRRVETEMRLGCRNGEPPARVGVAREVSQAEAFVLAHRRIRKQDGFERVIF